MLHHTLIRRNLGRTAPTPAWIWSQLKMSKSRNLIIRKLLLFRDIVRLFKMRGRQVGSGVSGGGGADWDSKWWLSTDLCTKCNFIWGAEFLPGAVAPLPPGYTTVAVDILMWSCVCLCQYTCRQLAKYTYLLLSFVSYCTSLLRKSTSQLHKKLWW